MGKRLYLVLTIILSAQGEAITAKEIKAELETMEISLDIKTVYRCIETINEFFTCLTGKALIISVRKKGVFIENEFYSDGQVQFLIDSIIFNKDLNYEEKEDLLDRVLKLSSFHQRDRLIYSDVDNKQNNFSLLLNLSTIMKAIEQQKSVSFQYVQYDVDKNKIKEIPSMNGNLESLYIFSPYKMIQQNNHYYVIGYNDKYKERLTIYRIDRMRQVQTSRIKFIDVLDQYDLDEEVIKMTNMFMSDLKADLVIEFDHSIMREVISQFGSDIIVKKGLESRYIATIPELSISNGLKGWILMMQDQVKVIQPLSLRDDIIKIIKSIYKTYN